VIIDVANRQKLKPDDADVTIEVSKIDDVLRVPNGALRFAVATEAPAETTRAKRCSRNRARDRPPPPRSGSAAGIARQQTVYVSAPTHVEAVREDGIPMGAHRITRAI